MLTSLSFIFLVGLAMGAICQKLKLPRIIGMLATGIVLGPYVLDLLDPSILSISSDLRKMALIIILLKAGLSLNLEDLKKVGRPAIMMAFVPATFELIGYLVFAPLILGITRVEAAVMGSVLAAVSPAVVVPRMVQLMENKYGTEKAIPQMIMAGASCDDIFVIVLFTTFLSMAQGGSADIKAFVNIPISIILGIILGAIVGYLLYLFFETAYRTWFFFSVNRNRRMAGRKNCSVRFAGSCKYGVCSENEMHIFCIKKTVREIWKALVCGRSNTFRSGRCCC